jgi:hypothetical protein
MQLRKDQLTVMTAPYNPAKITDAYSSHNNMRKEMKPRPSRSPGMSTPNGKRKLDFLAEADEDYEVVPIHQATSLEDESEEDNHLDISQALSGRKFSQIDGGDVTEDEEAEIQAMMGTKLKQDGLSTVKTIAAKGKGKEKETKGLTGGGSWQSMGKCFGPCCPNITSGLLERSMFPILQAWYRHYYVPYCSEVTRRPLPSNVLPYPLRSHLRQEILWAWQEPDRVKR